MKTTPFLSLAIFLLILASAQSQRRGSHVLLVLEKAVLKDEYSTFISSMSDQGFNIDVVLSSDDSVKLKVFGDYLYDHVVLLAPTVRQFSQSFGVRDLLDFVDAGGNLLVAADSDFSAGIRELAHECGVDLDREGTRVFDHFSFAQGLDGSGIPGNDSTIVAADITATQLILGDLDGIDPILFRGVAATIPPDSDLAVPALLAPSTAYSVQPKEKLSKVVDAAIGHEISLVSFVQAENNARVVILGSMEMLSNKFFDAQFKVWNTGRKHKSGNKEFCMAAALWAFQRRGVLIVEDDGIKHWKIDTGESPDMYRINDYIHFEMKVFEERDGKRVPFRGATDAQLEYRMLDPYIRTDLQEVEDGTWFADFKAPDVYGVFKFEVHYRRAGYSYIDIVQQAPIRPYRHNEFDRFLVAAFPYYASCFSMMIGFFLLGCLFLYI